MLVLSRKIGERIRIGDEVVLTVVRVHGDKVRLGIDAPADVSIHREEVYQRLARLDELGPHEPVAPRRAAEPGRGPGGDSSLSNGPRGR